MRTVSAIVSSEGRKSQKLEKHLSNCGSQIENGDLDSPLRISDAISMRTNHGEVAIESQIQHDSLISTAKRINIRMKAVKTSDMGTSPKSPKSPKEKPFMSKLLEDGEDIFKSYKMPVTRNIMDSSMISYKKKSKIIPMHDISVQFGELKQTNT